MWFRTSLGDLAMKSLHANIWTKNAKFFESAFLSSLDEQRSRLIVFGLCRHLIGSDCRVADIGGGGGRQAVLLAELGHSVTIVDLDPIMLSAAERRSKSLDSKVRQRLHLIEGTARDLPKDKSFDVVCCHSVLMYEEDWTSLVRDLVSLLRSGGILSIVCVNPEACAMTLGREGRWREAIASIATGLWCDPRCIPSNDVPRSTLVKELNSLGVTQLAWYGVGVFEGDSSEESFTAEWLAGSTDPYRSVARCYHIIGEYVGKERARTVT
jgi:S-adenosylmethionine-dependent methyltransferase